MQTKILITFDHRSVQDSKSLIQYAYPKIEHVCRHGRVLKVEMICRVQNGQHLIDSVVYMPRKHVVGLHETSRDMYMTVDLIVPKIERVSRKYTDIMNSFDHESAYRRRDAMED